MALTYGGATSHRTSIPNSASIQSLSVGTALILAYPTSDVQNGKRLIAKTNSGLTVGWRFGGRTDGTTRLLFNLERSVNDTSLAPSGNAYILNHWQWFVAAWDIAGSPTAEIYVGDLVTPVSSYASTTSGSGSMMGDSSVELQLGNNDGANNSYPGHQSIAMLYNRRLTLDEIVSLQFNPRNNPGCVGFWRQGDNGVGTQVDLSGNGNHGTVTGATSSPHAPIIRMRRAKHFYMAPYGVSAGTTYFETLSGSIDIAGTVAKKVKTSLVGTVSPIGEVFKKTKKINSGEIDSSGDIDTLPKKLLAGTISPVGEVFKKVSKSFSGSVTPVGTISKLTRRTLSGAINFIGTVGRGFSIAFDATISFVGELLTELNPDIIVSLRRRNWWWMRRRKR